MGTRVPDKDMFNGHPVIRNFSEKRLFRQVNGESLGLIVNCKGFPDGIADIYIHRKCASRFGTMQYDKNIPAYDILLIDDKYELYYDEVVDGRIKRVASGKFLGPEDVYELAMKSRERDLKCEDSVLPEIVSYTKCPINQQYIENEKHPYRNISVLDMYAGKF